MYLHSSPNRVRIYVFAPSGALRASCRGWRTEKPAGTGELSFPLRMPSIGAMCVLALVALAGCRPGPDPELIPQGVGWECIGSPATVDRANCLRACAPGEVDAGNCYRLPSAWCFTFDNANDAGGFGWACGATQGVCERAASEHGAHASACMRVD